MALLRLGIWRAPWLLVTLLAAAPAHAVCGNGVWEEDEACDDGNAVVNDSCNHCRLSCEKLHPDLVQPNCGLAAHGPFESVTAQAYPGAVYTDISANDTYYTITLSGSAGANRSGVIYAPNDSWVYAIYSKEKYPISVFSLANEEVPLLFEHAVTCEGGSGPLAWVKAYELSSSDLYTIALGPTAETTASIAVKPVGPSSPQFWDRDGDLFGGELAGLPGCDYGVSNTGAEPTTPEPGDCDDANADIHPGAAEVCDGADNDCAGDEDVGAAELCAAAAAGDACVDAGAATRCGCAVDADCQEGSTCDVAEQRCEADAAGGAGGAGGAAAGGAGGADGAGDAGEASAGAGQAGEASGGSNGGTSAGGGHGGVSGGGASGKAGSSHSTPAAGGEPADTGGSAEDASDGDCGCRIAGGGSSSASLFGLLAAVALGVLRRKPRLG